MHQLLLEREKKLQDVQELEAAIDALQKEAEVVQPVASRPMSRNNSATVRVLDSSTKIDNVCEKGLQFSVLVPVAEGQQPHDVAIG